MRYTLPIVLMLFAPVLSEACDNCLLRQQLLQQQQLQHPQSVLVVPSQANNNNGNGNGAVIQPVLPIEPPQVIPPISAEAWARLYFNARYTVRPRKLCFLPGAIIRQNPRAFENLAYLEELKRREDRLQQLQGYYQQLYWWYLQQQVMRAQPMPAQY